VLQDQLNYSFFSPNFGQVNLNLLKNSDDTYTTEYVERHWDWTNITGSGIHLVHSGSAILGQVIFNTARASSIVSIFDGLNTSGSIIARIEHGNSGGLVNQYQLHYNIKVNNGITVQVSDGDNITVTHR
jgi:hypothetical protein